MQLTITHRGGLPARPHLNATLERANRWIEQIPNGIELQFVSSRQLPKKIHNIWGIQTTVPRNWSVKLLAPNGSKSACIYVNISKEIDEDYQFLLERDIVTAILLQAFTQQKVATVVKETIKQESAIRYHIGRVLAEDVSGFLVNEDHAICNNFRAAKLARIINQKILTIQSVN